MTDPSSEDLAPSESIDVEMDRLLTPGGHLSRAEQDEVAANVFHQVASGAAGTSRAPWWKIALPFAVSSMAAAAALVFFVGKPPATAFTARGAATQVQVRCGDAPPLFYAVGEHVIPRCRGGLDIEVILATRITEATTNLALVSDTDDLRWALPPSSADAPAHSVTVAARGDEQLVLVHVDQDPALRTALVKEWGDKLASWKMPPGGPSMRLVFSAPLDATEDAP